MSSHTNYGTVDVKSIEMENDIVSNHANGKSTTIRYAQNASDIVLTLKAVSADADILSSESTVSALKVDVNGGTATLCRRRPVFNLW